MQDIYNSYDRPIQEMKRYTELGIPFSFSHKRGDGTIVIVRNASLRPQATKAKDRNAKYKLQYTNLDTKEPRSCYIPLLISFNGKLIDVSK